MPTSESRRSPNYKSIDIAALIRRFRESSPKSRTERNSTPWSIPAQGITNAGREKLHDSYTRETAPAASISSSRSKSRKRRLHRSPSTPRFSSSSPISSGSEGSDQENDLKWAIRHDQNLNASSSTKQKEAVFRYDPKEDQTPWEEPTRKYSAVASTYRWSSAMKDGPPFKQKLSHQSGSSDDEEGGRGQVKSVESSVESDIRRLTRQLSQARTREREQNDNKVFEERRAEPSPERRGYRGQYPPEDLSIRDIPNSSVNHEVLSPIKFTDEGGQSAKNQNLYLDNDFASAFQIHSIASSLPADQTTSGSRPILLHVESIDDAENGSLDLNISQQATTFAEEILASGLVGDAEEMERNLSLIEDKESVFNHLDTYSLDNSEQVRSAVTAIESDLEMVITRLKHVLGPKAGEDDDEQQSMSEESEESLVDDQPWWIAKESMHARRKFQGSRLSAAQEKKEARLKEVSLTQIAQDLSADLSAIHPRFCSADAEEERKMGKENFDDSTGQRVFALRDENKVGEREEPKTSMKAIQQEEEKDLATTEVLSRVDHAQHQWAMSVLETSHLPRMFVSQQLNRLSLPALNLDPLVSTKLQQFPLALIEDHNEIIPEAHLKETGNEDEENDSKNSDLADSLAEQIREIQNRATEKAREIEMAMLAGEAAGSGSNLKSDQAKISVNLDEMMKQHDQMLWDKYYPYRPPSFLQLSDHLDTSNQNIEKANGTGPEDSTSSSKGITLAKSFVQVASSITEDLDVAILALRRRLHLDDKEEVERQQKESAEKEERLKNQVKLEKIEEEKRIAAEEEFEAKLRVMGSGTLAEVENDFIWPSGFPSPALQTPSLRVVGVADKGNTAQIDSSSRPQNNRGRLPREVEKLRQDDILRDPAISPLMEGPFDWGMEKFETLLEEAHRSASVLHKNRKRRRNLTKPPSSSSLSSMSDESRKCGRRNKQERFRHNSPSPSHTERVRRRDGMSKRSRDSNLSVSSSSESAASDDYQSRWKQRAKARRTRTVTNKIKGKTRQRSAGSVDSKGHKSARQMYTKYTPSTRWARGDDTQDSLSSHDERNEPPHARLKYTNTVSQSASRFSPRQPFSQRPTHKFSVRRGVAAQLNAAPIKHFSTRRDRPQRTFLSKYEGDQRNGSIQWPPNSRTTDIATNDYPGLSSPSKFDPLFSVSPFPLSGSLPNTLWSDGELQDDDDSRDRRSVTYSSDLEEYEREYEHQKNLLTSRLDQFRALRQTKVRNLDMLRGIPEHRVSAQVRT